MHRGVCGAGSRMDRGNLVSGVPLFFGYVRTWFGHGTGRCCHHGNTLNNSSRPFSGGVGVGVCLAVAGLGFVPGHGAGVGVCWRRLPRRRRRGWLFRRICWQRTTWLRRFCSLPPRWVGLPGRPVARRRSGRVTLSWEIVRIVCWNTEYKRESWCFLCERHGQADVALLQEACTPPEEIAGRLDVGPGPWIHRGWNGARAVVRISNRRQGRAGIGRGCDRVGAASIGDRQPGQARGRDRHAARR